MKAVKNPDPEISRRAEESVKFIANRTALNKLEPREFDVIVTDDSKYTCTIISSSLRVRTAMFGEQTLRLTDVQTLRAGDTPGVTLVNAPTAPVNLTAYQNQFGKTLAFVVTAPVENNQINVWGTDVYTLDSNLAMAAIHAGLLKLGQSATVQIRVVPSLQQFAASTRNNISSASYGTYPSGAFEFITK